MSTINGKTGFWLGIFDISIKQQLTVPQENSIPHVPFNTETKTKLRNVLIHLPPSVIFDQKYIESFLVFCFDDFFLVFIKFEYLNISVCRHIFVNIGASPSTIVSYRIVQPWLTTSKVLTSAKAWNDQQLILQICRKKLLLIWRFENIQCNVSQELFCCCKSRKF